MKPSPIQTINDPKFIERLAAVEHSHWLSFIGNLIDKGKMTEEQAQEFKNQFVPYERLPEPLKEERRTWAHRIIRELCAALLVDEMTSDQYGG